MRTTAIVAAALLLAVPAQAQRYCYTLGADMAQCTDGTTAFSLGQGSVMILDPPQQAPIYVPPVVDVPTTTTRSIVLSPETSVYLPPAVLTVQELVGAVGKAQIDCMRNNRTTLEPDPVPGSCERWSNIEDELTARNMCLSRPGQVKADWRWHKCER